MMEEQKEIKKEHCIFFIQFGKKLPRYFFHMASHFSYLGVTLIPISPRDLVKVIGNRSEHLITVVDSLSSLKQFEDFKKRFLDMGLVNRRVELHCISSFESVIENFHFQSLRRIQFFQLPESIELMCGKITEVYFKDSQVSKAWPGGRRARLPQEPEA
jgi:hypothetical protein